MDAKQRRRQAEKQKEAIVFFLQPCANSGAIGNISDDLRQGEKVHLSGLCDNGNVLSFFNGIFVDSVSRQSVRRRDGYVERHGTDGSDNKVMGEPHAICRYKDHS